MNKDQLHGKWLQMKGAVKAQWGKLTNDDLDEIDGNLERLVGIVQERYGYARERAEKEIQEFQRRQASAAEEASRTR
jgi:uncharacterized protein YjbJ (UPF0337 family)